MFVTKLMLDVSCCHKRKLSDDYSIHRLVYSLFPLKEGFSRDFLYVDKGAKMGTRQVIVLSQEEPSLPDDIVSQTIVVGDNFFDYDRYRFEVLLNPVTKDSKTKKRVPVIGQYPLIRWFLEHQEKWGIEVDEKALEVFCRQSRTILQKGQSCVFHTVLFRGILKVSNRDVFRHSFEQGIGHGKAFGYGMLQLAPISSID